MMFDFFVAYLLFQQIVKEQPMRSYEDIFMECLTIVRIGAKIGGENNG